MAYLFAPGQWYRDCCFRGVEGARIARYVTQVDGQWLFMGPAGDVFPISEDEAHAFVDEGRRLVDAHIFGEFFASTGWRFYAFLAAPLLVALAVPSLPLGVTVVSYAGFVCVALAGAQIYGLLMNDVGYYRALFGWRRQIDTRFRAEGRAALSSAEANRLRRRNPYQTGVTITLVSSLVIGTILILIFGKAADHVLAAVVPLLLLWPIWKSATTDARDRKASSTRGIPP